MTRLTSCASANPQTNGGRQNADRAAGAVGVASTRVRCGRRTAIITRGYRFHGVTSFSNRRAELHALTVPCSSGAQPLSVLFWTTVLSLAGRGNPPWSLVV